MLGVPLMGFLIARAGWMAPFPLMTELAPLARATLMSFNVAALSLGRALGAPLAPFLYHFGFLAVAAGAVGFNLLALLGALRKIQK